MTVHLVTFATDDMSRSLQLCERSARQNGISTVYDWRPQELCETKIYRDHKTLLDTPRGAGYWAWKSFIVLERICELFDSSSPDHVVAYADAGVEFIAPVSHIIERMDQDIFLFGNNWPHYAWCKRDIVDEVWPSESVAFDLSFTNEQEEAQFYRGQSWARFGKQVQASIIFFRVSDYTRQFVSEWLKWCLFEDGRLIDDSPSRAPNHPEFRENRHDQAILTTLAYREGIKLHWWPAMYNRGTSIESVYEKLPEYASDDYPVLLSHHRRRNCEWEDSQ